MLKAHVANVFFGPPAVHRRIPAWRQCNKPQAYRGLRYIVSITVAEQIYENLPSIYHLGHISGIDARRRDQNKANVRNRVTTKMAISLVAFFAIPKHESEKYAAFMHKKPDHEFQVFFFLNRNHSELYRENRGYRIFALDTPDSNSYCFKECIWAASDEHGMMTSKYL